MSNFSSELQLALPRIPNTDQIALIGPLQQIHDAIYVLAQYLDGINIGLVLSAAYVPASTLRTSAINRMVVKANGALGEGLPVFFSLIAGELKATIAQASAAATLAMGFCSQPGGVANGAFGEFTPCMGITHGSYTFGTKYYLQNAGGYGATPGTINQCLGIAISTTELLFFLGVPA